jgi:ABC-type Fe3+-siderophore transport system permease subunit
MLTALLIVAALACAGAVIQGWIPRHQLQSRARRQKPR